MEVKLLIIFTLVLPYIFIDFYLS